MSQFLYCSDDNFLRMAEQTLLLHILGSSSESSITIARNIILGHPYPEPIAPIGR